MEKKKTVRNDDRTHGLVPPRTSKASMMLNDASNGMMLGGLPYVATEIYAEIAHKKIPYSVKIASRTAAILGAVVGAGYGIKEANELQAYRDTVCDEISKLRAQVSDTRQPNWVEKEKAKLSDGDLSR